MGDKVKHWECDMSEAFKELLIKRKENKKDKLLGTGKTLIPLLKCDHF